MGSAWIEKVFLKMPRALRSGVPRGLSVAIDVQRALPSYTLETVFDIGAHHGESARAFLRWTPGAKLYCFEPVSSAFAQLQKEFRSVPNVVCIQAALGSKKGSGRIRLNEYSDQDALLQAESDTETDSAATEVVPIITVDGYRGNAGIDRIGFLKVDTEGHDLEVLKGAQQLLEESRVDFVQVEAGMNRTNRLHVPLAAFQDYLEPRSYFLFALYEQMHEWPSREIYLRRVNAVFVSKRIIVAAKQVGPSSSKESSR